MRVPLYLVAHARSGDKGDASNVGLIADSSALYEVLRREVTAERVKEHFREVCRGEVERFEVPNLLALNFLLHDALGGGGTLSLKTDAQGKTHGQGILTMRVEVPDELLPRGADERLRAALERQGGEPPAPRGPGPRARGEAEGREGAAPSAGAAGDATAAASPASASPEAMKGL